VYLRLDEVEAVRAESGTEPPLADLLERGVLLRGLVFRCPLCAQKGWYGADELAERLRCSRCRRPFALTEPGWQPLEEPQWRYRLAEALWQLLEHNGDLPLRALRIVLGLGRGELAGPSAILHEQELWPLGAERPIELDICAQRGSQLWIGEAKTAPNLGTAAAAKHKLKGLRRAADVLRPHGIVLVTGAAEWTADTVTRAREALGGLPCELPLESCPPPARLT
jgi:hypothetical protein